MCVGAAFHSPVFYCLGSCSLRSTKAGILACWLPKWDRTDMTEGQRSLPRDSLTWALMWTLDHFFRCIFLTLYVDFRKFQINQNLCTKFFFSMKDACHTIILPSRIKKNLKVSKTFTSMMSAWTLLISDLWFFLRCLFIFEPVVSMLVAALSSVIRFPHWVPVWKCAFCMLCFGISATAATGIYSRVYNKNDLLWWSAEIQITHKAVFNLFAECGIVTF